MSVDHVRDCAEPRLQILDGQVRNLPFTIPHEPLHVPENRAGAARDRVGDERAAILTRAPVRGERVARTHLPAIGGDARDRHRQLREQRRNFRVGRGDFGDHVSSRTSLPSGGRTTLLIGASGGTPSSRSAVPMTLLKTGAATLPP